MIELSGVSKFGIIEAVTLHIGENDKIGLFGSNGSGKTTLLYLISGVYLPETGIIDIMGDKYTFPMSYCTYRAFEKRIRTVICFFESPDIFFDDFTIRQNLEFYLSLDSYDATMVEELLKYFDVNESPDKLMKDLSRGTRQKLLVVLGFSTKKNYVIFDEPTTGLDYESKKKFYDLLRKTNKTFIVSTHDVEYKSFFDKSLEIDAKKQY